MDLIWRQLPLAVLAYHPDSAGLVGGEPLKTPVDSLARGLCQRLLEMDGKWVAIQFNDLRICQLVAERGEAVMFGTEVVEEPGAERGCHRNSASIWLAEPEVYRIQTGFGLHGGVWRIHTWLRDRDDRVIETTVPQDCYFGAILNPEQAERFAKPYRVE